MIELTLVPIQAEWKLTSVSKRKDILTINGVELDFTNMPDNSRMLSEDIPAPYESVGQVDKINGQLKIRMVYPYPPGTDPEKLVVKVVQPNQGGAIALPV